MITSTEDELQRRITIKLDTDDPIPVSDLASFLSGANGFYEQVAVKYRETIASTIERDGSTDRLTVTRIETGCLLFELLPSIPLEAWDLIKYMDAGLIVREYYAILRRSVDRFSRPFLSKPTDEDFTLAPIVDKFLKPVFGKSNSAMRVSILKFKAKDGNREVEAEITFDQGQIDEAAARAATLTRRDWGNGQKLRLVLPEEAASGISTFERNVVIQMRNVNSGPGKRKGRPVTDTGTVASLSQEVLPVQFRTPELKSRLAQGQINPHANAFIVDLYVEYENGKPKHYTVLEVHGPQFREDNDLLARP